MNTHFNIALIPLLLLAGCDGQPGAQATTPTPQADADNQAVAALAEKVKKQLVFVEGGEFLMGDFGPEYGAEKLSYGKPDTRPLHKVALSSYSIGKLKATNQDYQLFAKINQVPLPTAENRYSKKDWLMKNKTPDTPAHMNWYDAEKYCGWLGKITGLPFALPTEAQWEYAARSRGQFLIVPTDNGELQLRKNVPWDTDREEYAEKHHTGLNTSSSLPGDLYPPNPLGIYDMTGNGFEWVKDWYDPKYYQHSPVSNPQGPEKPAFKDYDGHYVKVKRSFETTGPFRGMTIARDYSDPATTRFGPMTETVRCVVNSAEKINSPSLYF